MKLLIQTQLSNYDLNNKFILEADSGWQMMAGRCRVLLESLDQTDRIDILVPYERQCLTKPIDINPEVIGDTRVSLIETFVIANALATRYDFDFMSLGIKLKLDMHKQNESLRYTHVYLNDPMHLRHYKALFAIYGGYQPKFIVHSHFIDNPESPKFPVDASLWMGQLEAALKADYNFWQCQSALDIFKESALKYLQADKVKEIMDKSSPWDDGYSYKEIHRTINFDNVRFTLPDNDKVRIFVPNRVGGLGRSSDYTNCGYFLFDFINELAEIRDDFEIVAGNPSQKISNDEIDELCVPYVKYFDGTPTRDEYRYLASRSHIVVGLYDNDSYGGTAARECVDLGCMPFWVNLNEYKRIADQCDYPYTINNVKDKDEMMIALSLMIDDLKENSYMSYDNITTNDWVEDKLRKIIRKQCSYEETTTGALKIMVK